MGFPAPLVLTAQRAIQINQLQLQWDTLSQNLKWFPLASTIHICIHAYSNVHTCMNMYISYTTYARKYLFQIWFDVQTAR